MTASRIALVAALTLVAAGQGHADRRDGALSARLETAAPLVDAPAAPGGEEYAAPGQPSADTATPTVDGAPGPSLNPLWSIPLQSLTATRERPLFAPTRRPATPVIPAAAAPAAAPAPVAVRPSAPERPPLTLIGTILNPDKNIAIMQDETTQKVTSVRQGDEAEGWRVTDVSARAATVEKNTQIVTLELPVPGASGVALPTNGAAENMRALFPAPTQPPPDP